MNEFCIFSNTGFVLYLLQVSNKKYKVIRINIFMLKNIFSAYTSKQNDFPQNLLTIRFGTTLIHKKFRILINTL